MKKLFPTLVIAHTICLGIAIALLPREIVPIHWNILGQADRFGSKWMMMLFAAIPLLLLWGRRAYYASGMPTENMRKNRAQEEKTISATILLLIVVSWGIYALVREDVQDVGMVFPGILVMLVGALLVYVSNTMSTIKQNRFYGIKAPWTFRDETVWKKTHRFGAYTGVAGGLCTMLCGGLGLVYKLPVLALIGVFLGIFGVGILPTLYAWRLYRKLHPRHAE